MEKSYYHITKGSSNRKTGGMIVTTSSANTCPDNCPFKDGNGCYAYGGPLRIHWTKVSSGERGMEFEDFIVALKAIPRE